MNNRRDFLQNVGLGFMSLIGLGLTKITNAQKQLKNPIESCVYEGLATGNIPPDFSYIVPGNYLECECAIEGCYDNNGIPLPLTAGTYNNSISVTYMGKEGPETKHYNNINMEFYDNFGVKSDDITKEFDCEITNDINRMKILSYYNMPMKVLEPNSIINIQGV